MKIFKSKDNLPQERCAYAILTGDYAGEIIVYVNSDMLYHKFLSLPLMINRNIPKQKFVFGMNNNIIELVEKLPKNIFKIIKAQQEKNENIDNRREQFNSPNFLDSKDAIETH